MRHRPALDEFLELARSASLVPVYRQLIGDTLTPVSAFCKIQEGDWAFLFESVIGGERLGRYSFLGSGPFLHFEAFGQHVHLAVRTPGTRGDSLKRSELEHPDPLRLLEEQLLPKQRQSLEVARSGYLAGQIDFFNLTDAEQTLLRFGLAEAEARAQRELALAELSLLVAGVPPPGAPFRAAAVDAGRRNASRDTTYPNPK